MKTEAELNEGYRAEIESLRKRVADLESSKNFLRNLGITILDAKYLDPACHKGCQSLVHKARAERLQAALSQAYDALKYQLGADDWTPELNKRGIDALAAIAAALAGDTAKPEAKP